MYKVSLTNHTEADPIKLFNLVLGTVCHRAFSHSALTTSARVCYNKPEVQKGFSGDICPGILEMILWKDDQLMIVFKI